MLRKRRTSHARAARPLILLFFAGLVCAEAATGPLDGMQFTGIFGPAGKPGDRSETVYFAGGKFWTRECIPCGFGPALYTARRTGSEIHFSGHLLSAEKGRLYYEGVLRDRRLSVKVNWRKERWYWVIDRNFHFEGELASELGTGGERLRVSSPAENFHSEQGGDCKL